MDMEHDTESGFKRVWRRVLAVAILASGIGIGASWGTYDMQKQAIKYDAAAYNQTTGIWGWKDQDSKQKEKVSKAAEELTESRINEINKKCKALGFKKANDPECTLVGE